MKARVFVTLKTGVLDPQGQAVEKTLARLGFDGVSDVRIGKMVELNLDAKTVEVDGARVHLTGKEYAMLELLSLRKGTTLTKEMFLNHLYGGMDEPELKIIDVVICKLRKKLAQATGGQNFIETVWGRGYVLRDPQPVADQPQLAATA